MIKGIESIAERCLQVVIWSSIEQRLNQCNIALEIEKSFHYGLFDAKKSDELYEIGYQTTTTNKIESIKEKLK
ncbi:hypothetical protein ABI125_08450 [Tamlana crocina]